MSRVGAAFSAWSTKWKGSQQKTEWLGYTLGLTTALFNALIAVTGKYCRKQGGVGSVQQFVSLECGASALLAIGCVLSHTCRRHAAEAVNLLMDASLNANYLWLLVATFTAQMGNLCRFYALLMASAGDVVTVSGSARVLFAAVCGYALFEERYGAQFGAIALLICSGLVFLSQPEFLFDESAMRAPMAGVLLAAASGVLKAAKCTAVKALKDSVHSYTLMAARFIAGFFSAIAALLLASLSAVDDVWVSPAEMSGGVVVGWLSLGGLSVAVVVFGQMSYYFADLSRVSLAKCFSLVFAYILQIVFLGHVQNWKSYFGALLIVTGVVRLYFEKDKESSEPKKSQKTTH